MLQTNMLENLEENFKKTFKEFILSSEDGSVAR